MSVNGSMSVHPSPKDRIAAIPPKKMRTSKTNLVDRALDRKEMEHSEGADGALSHLPPNVSRASFLQRSPESKLQRCIWYGFRFFDSFLTQKKF